MTKMAGASFDSAQDDKEWLGEGVARRRSG
jgi:hypothetical protein